MTIVTATSTLRALRGHHVDKAGGARI